MKNGIILIFIENMQNMFARNKTLLGFVMISLMLAGSVYAQEIITYQNVKVGDYIRQYALIEVDNNGAVYRIVCPDCSSYITLTDDDGTTYAYNVSMIELEEGLFGYDTSILSYGKHYNARYETVSPTYGSAVIFGEVQISDKSEWIGSVNLDSVLQPQEITVEEFCESDLDLIGRVLCKTDSSKTELDKFVLFDVNLGKPVYYGLVFFVFLFEVVITTGSGIGEVITLFVTSAISVASFTKALIGESTRDAAIVDGLDFLLSIAVAVLKPFMWFFVIAELFILYKVSVIRSSGGMMLAFFNEHKKMIAGVFNIVTSILDIIIKFISSITSAVF